MFIKKIKLIIALFIVILIFSSCKPKVKSIEIDKSNLSLEVEEKDKLNVIFNPSNVTTQEIEWSSSDENVVRVDDQGNITAVSIGTAVITVEVKESKLIATSDVKILPKSVKEIKMNENNVELEVGETKKLDIEILPIDAEKPEIKWSSTDENIVKVNDLGEVTAISIGDAKIIASTIEGNHTAECDFIIKPKSVKSIKLNKESVTISKGDSIKLEAAVLPIDANDKKLIWSSSDTRIITVNEKGNVTGVSPGKANVIIKTEDGGVTTKCIVTVKSTEIKVEKSKGSMLIYDDNKRISFQFRLLTSYQPNQYNIWLYYGMTIDGKLMPPTNPYDARVILHTNVGDVEYKGKTDNKMHGVSAPFGAQITGPGSIPVDIYVTYKGKEYKFSDTINLRH